MSLRYLGNINILVIEDDMFNIQLIRALLAKVSDINVISTDDGAKGLDILENGMRRIDMVLLDLHLPQMQGREILKRIRLNSKFNDLPVLIITVDGMEENDLRDLGADDFMLKPFDIESFASTIALNMKKQ
ncbi:MAG: response regulator [Sulfurovum sp.]